MMLNAKPPCAGLSWTTALPVDSRISDPHGLEQVLPHVAMQLMPQTIEHLLPAPRSTALYVHIVQYICPGTENVNRAWLGRDLCASKLGLLFLSLSPL
jgi:hypothetical protein